MPRIPLPWLAEHVELPAGTTAEMLAADLVKVGLEEEAVHPAAVTGPLVVGLVVERTPEPQKNGKTINWCKVDVGAHNEVGEDGALHPRGIVCGAHNFDVGDTVVVALPGAVLPGPFAIAARKTYGHVSDGMICSSRELGLGDDHDGIILLASLGIDAAPGDDALALLGLGDEVLEINVTPDRGYCFSMRGVAREYSHSTGAAFTDPAATVSPLPSGDGFAVVISDDAPIHGVPGCDRFVAQVVRGVNAAAPSPRWMQQRLQQAGMRAISLAVDVTNYVMLDLGQPLHAYDLAGLVEPIVVRRARAGEVLRTLDDVNRQLVPGDLLVCDSTGGTGERALGLAGVMGGNDSEVTASTVDVLVEGAHFDPVTVARSSRLHKIPSEAARRFERGVDPALGPVAVQRVVDLLVEYGGGVPDPVSTDVNSTPAARVVELDVALPSRLVGVEYTEAEITDVLETIGCTVVGSSQQPGLLRVTVPTWRPDLTVPVDLVEEIARLRGYDAIPSLLPIAPAGRGLTRDQRLRRSIARRLADTGWVETLSYPFVGEETFAALGYAADDTRRTAVRLLNPMSSELPLLRTGVLQTLLDSAQRNVARGTVDLAIVELGQVTRPRPGELTVPALPGAARPSDADLAAIASGVPAQPRQAAGVLTGWRTQPGTAGPGRKVDLHDAIDGALSIARVIGAAVTVSADDTTMPWHPGRCAAIRTADGVVVGHAGELHPRVVAALGLPARSCAFEVELDALLAAAPSEPVQAVEVSTFPVAKEDVALVVPSSIPAAQVLEAVIAGATGSTVGDVVEDVRLFDVYEGDQVPAGHRSLAFALRLRAADRTLTAQESATVREAVVAEAASRCGAVLRS